MPLNLLVQGTAGMKADWALAVDSFTKAGRIYRDLALEPSVALVERNLAQLYLYRQQFADARIHARQALEISERLHAANPADQNLRMNLTLDLGQMGAGELEPGGGSARNAVPYFQRSVALREEIASSDPQNVRARERLAVAFTALAAALIETGDFTRAGERVKQGIAIFESLQEKQQLGLSGWSGFAGAIAFSGKIQRLNGNRQGACLAYQRAARMLKTAGGNAPLPQLWERLRQDVAQLKGCR